MKKIAASAVVGTLLIAGAVVLSPVASASALRFPGDCSYGATPSNKFAEAYCRSLDPGWTYYQLILNCTDGSDYFGAWRRPGSGNVSSVGCVSGSIKNYTIDVSAD